MQTGILPQLPMSQLCHPPEAVAPNAANATADLLSQCTTEWSRYFIASRIAPCGRYTAALIADLRPQSQPEHPRVASQSPRRNQQPPSTPHPPLPPLLPLPPPTTTTTPTPTPMPFAADEAADSSSDSGRGSEADGDSPTEPSDSPIQQSSAAGSDTTVERLRKRVQFADEVGQALTRVKLLSVCEPENRLPVLILAETHVATDCRQSSLQQKPGGSEPQLKCKFSQPSAKYVVFRESLERNLLSLSLVHLDPGVIRGSVAVKNISFRKRVFVRVSFDSWHSFQDIEAFYNGSEDQQDNFAFSLPCSSDQQTDVQFCVCFECDCGTFWDNNGGENYRIGVIPTAQAGSGYTRDFKPDYGGVAEFSEFSAWGHFDDQVYY